MKRFFASIVIAIAIICGYLTPAYAGDSPTTSTPAPQSGVTTPAPKPTTTAQPTERTAPTQTPQTSEKRKLANTGYSALIAGTFAILLVLFGAGIYSVSRKDN